MRFADRTSGRRLSRRIRQAAEEENPMKVALVGLPQSGKTSLFKALTGTEPSREKAGMTLGTVKVPDTRVDKLSGMYRPKKTTHAVIELVEAHAPHKNERKTSKSALDAGFLNVVKPMDAFLLVVGAFGEEGVNDPRADFDTLLSEMILADLMLVETRLERDDVERKKGKPGIPGDERDALDRCRKLLDNGQRIYEDADLAARPELRTYAFLTARPILAVVNVGEDDIPKPTAEVLARLGLPVAGIPTFVCCAKSEGEIQAMPEGDRKEFREMLGVREPVLDIMVREVYRTLGLVSFLTTGEDECRAWTIRRGIPAPRAAGAIHADIEKGFIRAEVIAYDDFIALGSEVAAKKAGKYRLEGREYVVQDGDIVHFRFNV
ncbi:MAG: redox-regulated ATPase YchF [Betaproteobacteria bacterium]|nr:redox-regulated ATPase YchF [Betaproteobacteria bacterium]